MTSFKKYIKTIFETKFKKVLFISKEEADVDESWTYGNYNFNCFSFCLPSKPHPNNKEYGIGIWRHDDRGIIVKKEAFVKYTIALQYLLEGINNL